MNLYTIHDQTAGYFMQPFAARNDGEATRSFSNAINDSRDPNNLLAKHPSQFALYRVASYSDETGQVTAENPITLLGNGSDYVNQQ